MARFIAKGYKKFSRALITEDEGALVPVTDPLMKVVNDAGAVIQDEAPASLDNNGTAAVTIYSLVDTTDAAFIDGEWVKAIFTFTIGDEVLPAVDLIFIGEQKL